MRDPAFTQTVQIGIVVRDLDVTRRNHAEQMVLAVPSSHASAHNH